MEINDVQFDNLYHQIHGYKYHNIYHLKNLLNFSLTFHPNLFLNHRDLNKFNLNRDQAL